MDDCPGAHFKRTGFCLCVAQKPVLQWVVGGGEEGGPPAPAVHGPVSQAKFLQSLGIEYRVKSLLEGGNVTEKQASDLVLGYRRLVGSSEEEIEGGFSGMGEVYKVMAIVARGAEEDEVPPVGF